ncbi:MAG: DNA/RNA non-specific endonuclease [Cryobacterium sp.]|nr:DNA/RNA non-specific endonuclease [Cryobacterium sp.]
MQYIAPQHRNKWHHFGPHSYLVDAMGRPSASAMSIRSGYIQSAPRDSCSTTVGSWGTPPAGTPWPVSGYVGGHLIAASLGGSPARINLTPQAQEINASSFTRIESAVRVCGGNSRYRVDFTVHPSYEYSSPLTPISYHVFVRVTPTTRWFPNGGGEGGMVIPNWTGASTSNTLANINLKVDAFVSAVRTSCL